MMNISQESIFTSAIRSFFVSAFAIFGIIAGCIPLLVFIGGFFGPSTEHTLPPAPILLPDAQGKREMLGPDAPTILQIDIQDVIGGKKLDAESVRKQLLDSREGPFKNNRVKGILLVINSPGGTVTDSDSIYRAITDYKKRYNVPVYAYVDGLCASGGYYIAAAADKIYSSDISLVGSIGVMMQFMNLSQTLEKIGIESKTLTAGKNKDAMNPMRPWTQEEDKNFQELIQHFYSRFISVVTNSRPEMDKELLVQEYGAKVFSAIEARDKGFLDGINHERKDALLKLVQASNIGDEKYQVIKLQSRHWLADIIEARSPLLSGKVTHEWEIGLLNDEKLSNKFLYLFSP